MGKHQQVVYAVGDVHGMYDLLEDLLQQIEQDGAQRKGCKQIVFLGDYVDRGPDSRKVIERLMGKLCFPHVCLKGNHEWMMVMACNGMQVISWLHNGGSTTVALYGAEPPPQAHLDWMNALPVRFETEHFHFVHGGFSPGLDFASQTEDQMLWFRPNQDRFDDRDWGKPVVHGHTTYKKPCVRLPYRIGLDTGAGFEELNVLTAMVACDGQIEKFLQARKS